jgi:2-polyprenyl-3-methyl-5-hydroxy-6-metoxy-1,4-benzoquinol methylase
MLPDYAPRDVIFKITRALPLVERVYAGIRFSILRPKLLSVMDLLLPDEGSLLDVGSGFGLFAGYFASTQPGRRITGIDPDERRVGIARNVARELGINAEFRVADARSFACDERFDAIYVLDVMHHILESEQVAVLTSLSSLLKPRGLLLMKDITTEPRSGLLFTEALDRLMVGFRAPLAYRHHTHWAALLSDLGFKVRMVRVPDVLPYPHVVIAATKRD